MKITVFARYASTTIGHHGLLGAEIGKSQYYSRSRFCGSRPPGNTAVTFVRQAGQAAITGYFMENVEKKLMMESV